MPLGLRLTNAFNGVVLPSPWPKNAVLGVVKLGAVLRTLICAEAICESFQVKLGFFTVCTETLILPLQIGRRRRAKREERDGER
jgi:hypothetical protein